MSFLDKFQYTGNVPGAVGERYITAAIMRITSQKTKVATEMIIPAVQVRWR